MPLATSLYDWLLFLHILAAALWLGGLVMISLLATLVLLAATTNSSNA